MQLATISISLIQYLTRRWGIEKTHLILRLDHDDFRLNVDETDQFFRKTFDRIFDRERHGLGSWDPNKSQ